MYAAGGRGDWAGREEWRANVSVGHHTSATSPSGSWLSGGAHTPQLEVPHLTSYLCQLTTPFFMFGREAERGVRSRAS